MDLSLFEIIALGFSLLFLPLLGTLFLNSVAGPMLRRSGAYIPMENTSVSVLIPARNEAHTITHCLHSLLGQTVQPLEILVLDDNSEDATAESVRSLAAEHSHIRLLSGKPLEQGWTGKNYACHQLSLQAKGTILLFTDADNTYHPEAIASTLATMNATNADMLSAFPQQFVDTWAEKFAVPLIDLFVYAALPLQAALRLPFASMTAANGQWIAFRKEAYSKIGGHSSVKSAIVEDVELSRRAKKIGLKVCTAAGTERVFGKMYNSTTEVWHGFGKNLFGIAGYNTALFFGLLFFLLLFGIAPYILPLLQPYQTIAYIPLAIVMSIRCIAAIVFRHPLSAVFTHPFGVLFVIAIGIYSYIGKKRSTLLWKGRKLS